MDHLHNTIPAVQSGTYTENKRINNPWEIHATTAAKAHISAKAGKYDLHKRH
jgi:hypothetical protein